MCLFLCRHIVGTETLVGNSPTASDDPAIKIKAAHIADSHVSPEFIVITHDARNRAAANERPDGFCRLAPTSPWLAMSIEALLVSFNGVDAEQADAPVIDLYGIAVDNPCSASDNSGRVHRKKVGALPRPDTAADNQY